MPSSTLYPQARIGAFLGILMTVLTASAIFLAHGTHPTTAPPSVIQQPQPTTTPNRPVHVVRPAVNPLLPAPLRRALERDPVVVAGFYNPHSPVEKQTLDEARAGAAAADVPFVTVNLLDDSVAGPLTALLPSGELLPNPGFAMYLRDGTSAYRSDGYLSRTGVMQAIKDSVPAGFKTSRPTVLFYTSNLKALLAKVKQESLHTASLSDVSCRLYGGNQRTGWQHVACVATVTHSGIAHRLTSVLTPRSCSRVTDVITVDGVVSHIESNPWPTLPGLTCKAAR